MQQCQDVLSVQFRQEGDDSSAISPPTAIAPRQPRSPMKPKTGVKLINAGEVLPRVPFLRHGMPAL